MRALWRALDEVDLVWVSAANPVGLLLAGLARLRRRRLAILVRQDTMAYYRSRLPSRAWTPVLGPLWLIDRAFKRVGRRHATTAVGAEIAAAYGAPRPTMTDSRSISCAASESPRASPRRAWEEPVELLTVGRIEPEKTPLLLAEALAELDRTGRAASRDLGRRGPPARRSCGDRAAGSASAAPWSCPGSSPTARPCSIATGAPTPTSTSPSPRGCRG